MMKKVFGVCVLAVAGLGTDAALAQGCADLIAERMETPGFVPLLGAPVGAVEDEYLVGDWDGDGCDNIAVRRGNTILMDTDFDGQHDIEYKYGAGNSEDQYLVGDWDADDVDEIAVRRGNDIWMDDNSDGAHDRIVRFGTGDGEDDYMIGELDGDTFAFPDISVRRGNLFIRDLWPWDGAEDGRTTFGGKNEDQYLLGHWEGSGTRQTYAVRRGNQVLMNYEFDGTHDFVQIFGGGDNEDEYLVGDWDGDGLDNLAVRRGNTILMDFDFDGDHELSQTFGRGTE